MDDLIIKKIWKDITFYEITFEVETEKIKAKHNLYVNQGALKRLSENIDIFVNENRIIKWNDADDEEISSVFIEFIEVLNNGEVLFKITIKDDNYQCLTSVNTYLGNLIIFSDSLKKFDDYDVDTCILLSEL